MEESRRGFLSKLIGTGTALLLPTGKKEIVTTELLTAPPHEEAIDLGEYVLIPKKAIRSWCLSPNYFPDHLVIQPRRKARVEPSRIASWSLNVEAEFLEASCYYEMGPHMDPRTVLDAGNGKSIRLGMGLIPAPPLDALAERLRGTRRY